MKHIKTYESYNHELLNEEFLGLEKLTNKLKEKFNGWKDKKQKKVSSFLINNIEKHKNDPKLKSALQKLKEEASKLGEEDIEKISKFVEMGKVPNIPGEPVKNISESLLLEKKNDVVAKIISWLGLSITSVSFVTLLVTVSKIVIAESGFPTWLFDISLGQLGAILMVSAFIGGIIHGVGSAMKEE